MPIHSLELANVGPFRRRPDGSGDDGVKLEFDANVNLFIGPNNVGKSTILQALVAVITRHTSEIPLPQPFLFAIDDFSEDDGRAATEFEMSWGSPIGDDRELSGILSFYMNSFSAFLTIWSRDGVQEIEGDDIDWYELGREFGYVDYHNPGLPPKKQEYVGAEDGPNNPSEVIKEDHHVYEAVEYKRHGTQFERAIAAEIDQVISEIMREFRVEMGIEVFEPYPASYGDYDYYQWREGQEKFVTTDGNLTFPELSHGTRSVFAWVARFMLGMARHYRDDMSWKRRYGIFIIDEIDAHLHPSWQRRIIPTLQRHFPNVQIFASTHSPMMVAGLKKGQVHLLKRDATGQVVWSRNERDIIGWTADEIYRKYMEIDDPTDERTARHAEELRELRNKDNLTPEDEVRMQELRRLVNEDLLAGGWLKAQDERFDEMMRRFMANRQSDLSQDGA